MVRIGPAGWAYKDWKGIVYLSQQPRGFHEAGYLARFFDTIEINVTFYRPIRAKTAEDWIGSGSPERAVQVQRQAEPRVHSRADPVR